MLSINRVMLTGRLTRDPETKYLPSGQALTNLGIAVDNRFKDKSGEWRSDTAFVDVETWGKTAERAAETLKKGQPVYVEGRLKMDTWEKDGRKLSKLKITADSVKGFDVPKRGENATEPEDECGAAETDAEISNRTGRAHYTQPTKPMPSDNLDFGERD